MKTFKELIKQDTFTRQDLIDISIMCDVEGNLAPLYAVSYIDGNYKLTEKDISRAKELADKYNW